MLDSKYIEENMDKVRGKLAERGAEIDFEEFWALDRGRKEIIKKVEKLERERNIGSKKVGELRREGKKEEAQELQEEMKRTSVQIKELGELRARAEEAFRNFLLTIPNISHDSVPVGGSDADNVEIRKWGEPKDFDFEPKDHVEIGKDLDILDLDRAAKITGARFALYKGLGARLERALINFMLDLHTNEHGYTEVLPPFMANTDSFIGTGNLPKFEEDLFKIEGTDFYLVPTAEVPVTNIHRDEILKEDELPIKYVAYTPCFRSEAGSYGKDVRGIIRQHQFNKVELVKFSNPDSSYEEHESLTENAARVLELLGLPYRVVLLCTGDMGFSSAKTYDLEVWVPSENTFREISSCSNFEDFQARRASIRYRPKDGSKVKLVHTLNGSGLAVGRTVIGILENFQEADGSVTVPEVLVPYMGGVTKISN
ncbi:MAG: serine--tRNA ligase [Candidatus Dadabacteria bacterium]|nr:MAG: serine--tRNA ligase [Candidatus Dadabacteria bacterium]TDJ02345.1 MAG: serine--tRNA ligase [Candidatus Dadabacteria bacterium]